MAEITAALVKELRDKTSAGMMDCKKALAESNGDMEAAITYLREKGITKAAAKADRAANQGIITTRVAGCGCCGVILELNCETDFVSRNEGFQSFVAEIADALMASDAKTLEEALAVPHKSETIDSYIKTKVMEIGENMMLRKFARLCVCGETEGVVASYIHMGGKVGVLLKVLTGKEETTKAPEFQTLVSDLTMHIAAEAPMSVDSTSLAPSYIEQEQSIARAQLIEQGKPEAMLDKILPGKLKALYKQSCLIEQEFVKNPDISVAALLEQVSKQLGDTITVVAFSRFQLGT